MTQLQFMLKILSKKKKTKKKKEFSGYREVPEISRRGDYHDGGKKLKCSFVNGELWVGFGAQEFKERKRLL